VSASRLLLPILRISTQHLSITVVALATNDRDAKNELGLILLHKQNGLRLETRTFARRSSCTTDSVVGLRKKMVSCTS
jgi:hypothetical protein